MSLNFGFSLPALLKYGIGGFDPFNQSGPTLDLVFAGTASEMLSGGYTLDTNFIVPQYEVAAQYSVWENGVGMAPKTFSDIVTFTRASSATLFDSTGTLVFAPMNAIRNNTMQGAVAGTPGTLPTNWSTYASSGSGVTRSIVGTGIENGINYVDVRFAGTPSASAVWSVLFEGGAAIAALTGQTWTLSTWASVVGGSTTNVTSPVLFIDENTAAGAYVTGGTSAAGATSTFTRYTFTRTLSGGATVGAVSGGYRFSVTAGAAIDITLRIGMPQLQLGSTATAVNATSGTAYQGPRFDYDPSTLAARGLLIEEQRVNSIRNNTMQGAVAGTPGTLPTNWAISGLGTLTQTVVGTGTANGITYIDLRFSGTTSTTSVSIRHEPGGTGGVAAANGQSWAQSAWTAVIAGSTTNINQVGLSANIYDSGGAFLASVPYTNFIANTTSTLTRVTPSGTIATVGTAFIQPQIYLTFSSGAAIDITLRIGLPQLELGAFATSVIPTTTTATTRSADVASVNTLSPWYNSAAGTIFFAGQRQTNAADFNRAVSFNDGSGNNVLSIYCTTNKYDGYKKVSGGPDNFYGGPTVGTLLNVRRTALASDASGMIMATDGTLGGASTAAGMPTVTTLTIGSEWYPARYNGWIQRITYYPRRMPNAQLQTITT